jgi:hypothetical protein
MAFLLSLNTSSALRELGVERGRIECDTGQKLDLPG